MIISIKSTVLILIFSRLVLYSGMDSGSLLCGRPYGGCTILYRNSYAPCITPISSCSQRFCGVKVLDSSGLSLLLISLYMPAACHRLLLLTILIHLERDQQMRLCFSSYSEGN